MAEQPSGDPVPARLHELAQLLRQAHHLGPEAQAELAQLVDELSQSLDPASLPEASRRHLDESKTHLVNALRGKADVGRLSATGRRLEEAALRLEAEAPQVTGILRRLIDILANLGI
jgi:hypothetical protein